MARDNELEKKGVSSIRDEGKANTREFMSLLQRLDLEETKHFAEGKEEIMEMLEELGHS